MSSVDHRRDTRSFSCRCIRFHRNQSTRQKKTRSRSTPDTVRPRRGTSPCRFHNIRLVRNCKRWDHRWGCPPPVSSGQRRTANIHNHPHHHEHVRFLSTSTVPCHPCRRNRWDHRWGYPPGVRLASGARRTFIPHRTATPRRRAVEPLRKRTGTR